MASPTLSRHFESRQPSSIRISQIRFAQRTDGVAAINVAIGNVSLPMHSAMIARMRALGGEESPFHDGVVKYTTTVGMPETNSAFLNVIASSGFDTRGLHCQVTDGGSQAMELMILGTCGPVRSKERPLLREQTGIVLVEATTAGSRERPLLLLEPAYTNYLSFAERLGRATVSVARTLRDDGTFALPDLAAIERTIEEHRPGALVVIPYDNPTGQFYDQAAMTAFARLCVKHGLWMVSDEAYRELHYGGGPASSIWGVSEAEAPGISGRRISIESASKVWNGCGLRIGALVTDSRAFHEKAVAENTAGLCSNAIGQWIFGALAALDHAELRSWYERLRSYYRDMLHAFAAGMRDALPGVIVSNPDAAIYSVVDVRKVVRPGFDALQFVDYCATKGRCELDGRALTLLTAPLAGFYKVAPGSPDPGLTQLRVAFVEPPETMRSVPRLFAELLGQFERQR